MTAPLVRTVTIQNKKGLHARAAAKFVKCAEQYACRIVVNRGDAVPNAEEGPVVATSILGLMMLGAEPGTELCLRAEGEDSAKALQALITLVENKFDEGE